MRVKALDVAKSVAYKHGLTPQELFSKARYRRIAWPRQEAMYEIFVRCPHMSYPMIGKLFGRDHTTCLYGVKEHCERSGIPYAVAQHQRLSNLAKIDEPPVMLMFNGQYSVLTYPEAISFLSEPYSRAMRGIAA